MLSVVDEHRWLRVDLADSLRINSVVRACPDGLRCITTGCERTDEVASAAG